MHMSRAVSGILILAVLQLEEATWNACDLRMNRAAGGILEHAKL